MIIYVTLYALFFYALGWISKCIHLDRQDYKSRRDRWHPMNRRNEDILRELKIR